MSENNYTSKLLERDYYLEGDIPPHIVNTDILQAAQMGCIGLVREVGADDIQGQACFTPDHHIRSG